MALEIRVAMSALESSEKVVLEAATIVRCSSDDIRTCDAQRSICLIGYDRSLHRNFMQPYYPSDSIFSLDFVAVKFVSMAEGLTVGIRLWGDSVNLGSRSPGYPALISSHASRHHGLLLHIDSSRRETFDALDDYMQLIRGGPDVRPAKFICVIALIPKGKPMQVSREEALEFTRKQMLPDPGYIEFVPGDHSIDLTEVLKTWIRHMFAPQPVSLDLPQPLLHSI